MNIGQFYDYSSSTWEVWVYNIQVKLYIEAGCFRQKLVLGGAGLHDIHVWLCIITEGEPYVQKAPITEAERT